MKIIACFTLGFIIAFSANASESVRPKIKKFEYLIQLPKPFNKVKIGAELNEKNALAKVYVKNKFLNVRIDAELLSEYKNIDLASALIYEGIAHNIMTEKKSDTNEYLIDDFSLCFEYGEYKKGKRLNKEGWYKDSLRILIKKNSRYELIDNPVEQQNIPDGICIK